MRMIGLKATGLKDTQFLQIIDLVSQLGQRIEGRHAERLELLDVSCASFYLDAAGVLSLILLVWKMLIHEDTLRIQALTTVCKASRLDLRHTPPEVHGHASFRRALP